MTLLQQIGCWALLLGPLALTLWLAWYGNDYREPPPDPSRPYTGADFGPGGAVVTLVGLAALLCWALVLAALFLAPLGLVVAFLGGWL